MTPASQRSASQRYVADTNVYVTAANDPEFRDEFERFIGDIGPLVVSTIVVAEVLIGISDHRSHPEALRALTGGARPRAPRSDDWIQAGAIVARLGGDAVTKSRSFWNDVLLAAQCARLGVVLVTGNASNFRRIARYVGVRPVAPFPHARAP